jgi:VanZ family protein
LQEDRTVSNKTIIKLCSVAAFILLVGLALGPSKMVPRSGLGWEFDHFFGYFALTLIACLVWPRPLVIGAAFVVLAALLEGLQAFTPDRTPDLDSVLFSAAGTISVVFNGDLFIRTPRWLAARTLEMMLPHFSRLNVRTALLRFSHAIRIRASGVARGLGYAITPSGRTGQSAIAIRVIAGSSLKGR